MTTVVPLTSANTQPLGMTTATDVPLPGLVSNENMGRPPQRAATIWREARPRQVLIADDDEDILQGAILRLQSAGYNTVVAHNGTQIYAIASADQFDVVVLDVRMPECSGLQALAELRASPRTCSIPVVMLSASLADRQKALHAGARFFLDKPYAGAKLVEAVHQAIIESKSRAVT